MKKSMFGNFTQVPNEIIIDEEISAKAFRFWVYLESKPDTWNFYDRNIVKEFGGSLSTILRLRKELKKAGYINFRMRVGGLWCS